MKLITPFFCYFLKLKFLVYIFNLDLQFWIWIGIGSKHKQQHHLNSIIYAKGNYTAEINTTC